MNQYLINYAKWLVGEYYHTPWNKTLAIYASWAPSIPKQRPDYAQILGEAGIDFVAPDYYGYWRSAWVFDVKQVIQTLYDTVQVFKLHHPLVNVYGIQELLPPAYEEIVVIGSSYGWRASAALPKFDSDITQIVLLAPFLESNLWDWEETDEEFLRTLVLWYQWLYRTNPEYDRMDALLGFEELFDLDDLSHLEKVQIFVGHGSADRSIAYHRSEAFIENLQTQFSAENYKLALYYGLGHWGGSWAVMLQWRLHRRQELMQG